MMGYLFPMHDQFCMGGYPFPYFSYPAGDNGMSAYQDDLQNMYSGFHICDAALFGAGRFPDMRGNLLHHADHPDQVYHTHMDLGPPCTVTCSPSVECGQLHQLSAEPKK